MKKENHVKLASKKLRIVQVILVLLDWKFLSFILGISNISLIFFNVYVRIAQEYYYRKKKKKYSENP